MDKLAEARKRIKMTQTQVAKELGISRSFYGLIEIGKRRPTYGMAKRLADLFLVQIEDLFFGIEGFKMNRAKPDTETKSA